MTAPTIGLIAEQVLQRPPGGIGTYVRGLLGALPDHGVEVRPITARHPRADLRAAGLDDAIVMPLPRPALYRSWSRLGRPRIPSGPQLIHAASLAFPTGDRRPLVVTVHDLFFRTFPDTSTARGRAFHERGVATLSRATIVLVPSEAIGREIRALPSPPADVRVTPLGCDLRPPRAADVRAARDALGLAGPYVLSLATREPRKNLDGAIRAFARAHPDLPDGTVLVLAGPPGWGDDPVAATVDGTGMRAHVRQVGFVPEERKPGLLAGAAALLFPSLAEGFGFPVLEAMAVGTPVVTGDGPSLRELVDDAALTVDPTDGEAIAHELVRVMTDDALARELRERGLARAATFTWARTAELTVAAYLDALQS